MKTRHTLCATALLLAILLGDVTATTALAQTQEDPEAAALDDEAAIAKAAGQAASEEERKKKAQAARRRRRYPNRTEFALGEGTQIKMLWGHWDTDSPDYAGLATTSPGEIAVLRKAAPPKLWTDLDLLFGEVRVRAGNVAENYPGVYSLWLRRTGDGWNLIFNNKPDVWGTMHDPAEDEAEIQLEYTETEESAGEFTAKLEESEGGGTLTITWGTYRWSTPFQTAE